MHSQLAGSALIYNEPVTIRHHGELNVPALERSLREIIRRHEAWRTTFEWKGEHAVQVVQPPPKRIEIPSIDLRDLPNPEREDEAKRIATQDARLPFDLSRGPMYRLRLVRMGDADNRLYLTLHHIIFDGMSLYRVLLPELQKLYAAFAKNESALLPDLPIQYSDYAAWQRSAIKEITERDLPYWSKICRDLPALDLPLDRPRPSTQTYAGATESLHVSTETSATLKAIAEQQGATPFMMMVATFMALLHSYSGQEEIVIGGVSSGRHHSETMGLLGCFLNTIPIRCAFSKDNSFTDLLGHVRTATLSALSHDQVPFELLVQNFAQGRDPSRAPLVQALVVVEPPLEPLGSEWEFSYMDVTLARRSLIWSSDWMIALKD